MNAQAPAYQGTSSFLIELPFPAKILWPNGRGHHLTKHREFRKHKDWAHIAVVAEVGSRFQSGPGLLRIAYTIYPKTRHEIDRDNAVAAMKAYQDGIALGLKVDDAGFDTPVIRFGEPVKNGKVVVLIGGGL